jgi:PleD family two-component response regulator
MKDNDNRSRILIVDDQLENIWILTEVLKAEYTTVPASSGEAALKKAMEEPAPDLILLDILMPGIDGYEVCRRLKDNPQTQGIPVIFITAISEVMDAAKAFELGGVDYVAKPFNPVTVRARIQTHIQLSHTMKALKQALDKVKVLNGLLPICANCKKVRDDKGYWSQIEAYLDTHSEVTFSHGICPDCREKLYSGLKKKTYQLKE